MASGFIRLAVSQFLQTELIPTNTCHHNHNIYLQVANMGAKLPGHMNKLERFQFLLY